MTDSARIVNGAVVREPRLPITLERLARAIVYALSIPKSTAPRLRKVTS